MEAPRVGLYHGGHLIGGAVVQESPNVMRAYDMVECLTVHHQRKKVSASGPSSGASAAEELALAPRSKLRRSSQSLQVLVKMVGESRQVYKGIVQLCVAKFRDSEASNISMLVRKPL